MPAPILITNVRIFDGTGAPAFPGRVLIDGERIHTVARGDEFSVPGARVIDGNGGTLMPGLVEAHAHLAFPSSVERIIPSFGLPPEESLLISVQNARILLDHGFTSAYSAGTLGPRLDVVVRNEIAAGRIPGPRLKASAVEQFPSSMAHYFHMPAELGQSGPGEIKAYIRQSAELGVDIVKFLLSGEDGLRPGSSKEVCYSEPEVVAMGEQARESGVWLSGHAHANEAIRQGLRAGFRMLYHCTHADEETVDMIEARRDQMFVGPTLGSVECFIASPPTEGTPDTANKDEIAIGFEKSCELMKEFKRRGIRLLPGGDYGFDFSPIGENAKDIELFVRKLGFTEGEALVAATRQGAELMDMADELGLVRESFLADLLVVDGDPTQDIALLQDSSRLKFIMQNGRMHKTELREVNAQNLGKT